MHMEAGVRLIAEKQKSSLFIRCPPLVTLSMTALYSFPRYQVLSMGKLVDYIASRPERLAL